MHKEFSHQYYIIKHHSVPYPRNKSTAHKGYLEGCRSI